MIQVKNKDLFAFFYFCAPIQNFRKCSICGNTLTLFGYLTSSRKNTQKMLFLRKPHSDGFEKEWTSLSWNVFSQKQRSVESQPLPKQTVNNLIAAYKQNVVSMVSSEATFCPNTTVSKHSSIPVLVLRRCYSKDSMPHIGNYTMGLICFFVLSSITNIIIYLFSFAQAQPTPPGCIQAS